MTFTVYFDIVSLKKKLETPINRRLLSYKARMEVAQDGRTGAKTNNTLR